METAQNFSSYKVNKDGAVVCKIPVFWDSANGTEYIEFSYSLSNFSEIKVTTPKDGQVLTYDADAEAWINAAPNTHIDYAYLATLIKTEALGFGYGTCSTEQIRPDKHAFIANFILKKNGYLSVRFLNAVQAGSTLVINHEEPYPIYYRNSAIKDGIICSGDTCTFLFDGSHFLVTALDHVGVTGIKGELETKYRTGNVSLSIPDITNLSGGLTYDPKRKDLHGTQYESMPTPSSSLEGKIIQYVGPTQGKFQNGRFYKCTNGAWVDIFSGGSEDPNELTPEQMETLLDLL